MPMCSESCRTLSMAEPRLRVAACILQTSSTSLQVASGCLCELFRHAEGKKKKVSLASKAMGQ